MFNKYTAIFLVLLLCLNNISSIQIQISPLEKSLLPSFSLKEILSQLKQDAQTSEVDPKTFRVFVEKIKALMTNMIKEQQQHKLVHDKMAKQCVDELAFRKLETSTAQDALTRSTEARSKCLVSLNANLVDKTNLNNAKTNYIEEAAIALKQRNSENEKYKIRKSDFDNSLAFINNFVGKLDETFSTTATNTAVIEPNTSNKSTVNVEEKSTSNSKAQAFVSMSETLLEHASKLGALSGTLPILIAIAQTNGGTNVPDGTSLADLKASLKTLLSKISDDSSLNDQIENKSLKTYTAYNIKITQLINRLDKNLVLVEKQINDMSLCLLTEDKITLSAGAKLLRNTNLLNSAKDMCGKFDEEFVLATKAREEQVEALIEIVDILNKRFGNITKGLNDYLLKVQEGWMTYINSTEFKSYTPIVTVRIDDNENGRTLSSKSA